MLRIEAYPVLDGLTVQITGHCEGQSHGGARCYRTMEVTRIPAEDLEGLGVEIVLQRAILEAIQVNPRLLDLTMC